MHTLIRYVHNRWVFRRRVRVLSNQLSELIPRGSTVLDVGCGDGSVGFLIQQNNHTVSIQGLEPLPRAGCLIECKAFDGVRIPWPDSSVDVCMFVDVLHHLRDIERMLKEAWRTSRRHVLIKDHLSESKLDFAVLQLMDWVGNWPHDVKSPYNYQTKAKWFIDFASYDLRVVNWTDSIPLYPPPFTKAFGRRLHFIALLEKEVNEAPRVGNLSP